MKIVLLMLCAFLYVGSLSAQQSLAGTWNTGKDNTVIEISEVNGSYQGVIVSSDNPKAKAGKQMLKEVKAKGNKWKGKLFSAKKGKWFDAVLEPKTDQLSITVSAGLMSKTISWAKE